MSLDQDVAQLKRDVAWLRSRMTPPMAGEFLDSASSPGDDLKVRVFEWDGGEHAFGPVRWSPMGGALPEAGDEAVIVERDDGVWQVVAWWSSSQDTGVAKGAVDALDARLDVLEAHYFAAVTAGVATASPTYTDLSGSAGPSVTIGKSGTYVLSYGCNATAGVNFFAAMSPSIAGASATDADMASEIAQAANTNVSMVRKIRVTLTAGDTIVMKYRASGSVTFERRWLEATPI